MLLSTHWVLRPVFFPPSLRPGVTVRIGIDARLADYTVGGIARYTVQLVDALRQVAGEHELVGIRSRRPKVSPSELATHQALAVHTPPHHLRFRGAITQSSTSTR